MYKLITQINLVEYEVYNGQHLETAIRKLRETLAQDNPDSVTLTWAREI